MLSPCSSGEICRNSSEHEGIELGSRSRATYNKWKHWKIKPEFCLGSYGKFVFDSGICTCPCLLCFDRPSPALKFGDNEGG